MATSDDSRVTLKAKNYFVLTLKFIKDVFSRDVSLGPRDVNW